jgi:hypothetical protein
MEFEDYWVNAIIKLLGFDALWSEVKKGTIEDYLIKGGPRHHCASDQ